MNKASRPHDDAVIEMLRDDPAFADEYLSACTECSTTELHGQNLATIDETRLQTGYK